MTFHLPLLERGCGTCTACCETLQVKSLSKGDYERCKHLRRGAIKGCAIYKDRPSDCAEYVCLWKAGAIEGASFRPDKCGFVLSISEMSVKNTETGEEQLEPFIMIHETKSGASRTPRVTAVLQSLAEEFLIIEIMKDGTRKVRGGPTSKVQRMIAIAKEQHAKGTPGYFFEEHKP